MRVDTNRPQSTQDTNRTAPASETAARKPEEAAAQSETKPAPLGVLSADTAFVADRGKRPGDAGVGARSARREKGQFFKGAAAPGAATAARPMADVAPAAAQAASTGINSVQQATQSWVSQWGPTASNDPAGSNDHRYGFADCGPTSAVTLASALGLMQKPSPQDAYQAIDHMRDLAVGKNTNYSQDTNDAQIATALHTVGAQTQELPTSLAAVDKALGEGKMLLLGGDPWNAWGKDMCSPGGKGSQVNYLNSHDPGGHFISVLGKTPDGKYLVSDPLSKVGAIAVSGAQLQQFFKDGGSNSGAMAVWNPNRTTGAGSSAPPDPAQATVPQQNLKRGDTGPAVDQLQHALEAAHLLPSESMRPQDWGTYGQKTQTALAALQKKWGIQGDDGKDFGPRTRDALQRELRGEQPPAAATSQQPAGVAGTGAAAGAGKDLNAAQIKDILLKNAPADSPLRPIAGPLSDHIASECARTGVPAWLLMSQMQFENQFGAKGNATMQDDRPIFKDGKEVGTGNAHNLFGAAGANPNNKGEYIHTKDGDFRAYPSYQDSVTDYVNFVSKGYKGLPMWDSSGPQSPHGTDKVQPPPSYIERYFPRWQNGTDRQKSYSDTLINNAKKWAGVSVGYDTILVK